MSHFSYINLIKREAKKHGKSNGMTLALAQERIARDSGFAHFHEMIAVSKSNPHDERLMIRALGLTNFDEVLYQDPIWAALDLLVEDALSGPIAETNAGGFLVENLEVSSAEYDDSSGIATLDVYFEYHGEQDEDRVWHGSAFYIHGQIQLIYRDGWSLVEDEALLITEFKTDQDLDHEQGLDDLYEDYLALQQAGGEDAAPPKI
jgi:hypothetical protein